MITRKYSRRGSIACSFILLPIVMAQVIILKRLAITILSHLRGFGKMDEFKVI